MTEAPLLAVITGPTGAGKSDLAVNLASALGGEIINADSMALYCGFDIGTAKPSLAEREKVPHHLIDILAPDQSFDAAAYLRLARPIVEQLTCEGKPALAVGGTGFYLRSLIHGLFEGPGRGDDFRRALALERDAGVDLHARLAKCDPETASRLAPADRVRIERALEVFHLSGRSISEWQREHGLTEKPFRLISFIIDRPPAEMARRLEQRTRLMFERGLMAETEKLLAAGWDLNLKPFGAIGYKEALEHLRGLVTLDEAMEKTITATRRYAKRQRTWFRGQMPEALWYHPDQADEILVKLREFFCA